MNQATGLPQVQADELPLPSRPVAFLWHYICARPWHFGGLLALIIGAASCAVAVQYGMKLLVDAMAQGTADRGAANVWWPLGLFIGLIVTENVFWRLGGWLGCRTVVASVVDIRVDLFKHLTGHPMRYFTRWAIASPPSGPRPVRSMAGWRGRSCLRSSTFSAPWWCCSPSAGRWRWR